ncbi:hypothetical protein FQN54_008721 [Arachnomyces sp. PD_36]|nr:hypothetical protein FQN54_008721 [Arachnomyces sp. PD_36]
MERNTKLLTAELTVSPPKPSIRETTGAPATTGQVLTPMGSVEEMRTIILMHGSYYYKNSNGSTYYNDGNGKAVYTPPNGSPVKMKTEVKQEWK